MTGRTLAAMAASIALLSSCHAAGLTGAGASGPAASKGGAGAKAGAASTAADRRRLLGSPGLCDCPIFLEATGPLQFYVPVDLVVDNFKVGTARLDHIRATFQPNGTVAGDFLFTNVNYEHLDPPQPHPNYPHGSSIQGTITGTAVGFNFSSAGPWSLFDWPPPNFGSAIQAPGFFTTNNVVAQFNMSFLPRAGSETLPVTNPALISDFVIKMEPPTQGVPRLEIFDGGHPLFEDDPRTITTFRIEEHCNGVATP